MSRLLAAKGFARNDSDAALDRLSEQGYLDDRRFADRWARSRLRTKPMGPHRLGRELQTRGIEDSLVRAVLKELYEEGEEQVARRAMAGKLRQLSGLPAASRAGRLARFLQGRGFSHEVIRGLLREGERAERNTTCSG